jgi:hypothetical protein
MPSMSVFSAGVEDETLLSSTADPASLFNVHDECSIDPKCKRRPAGPLSTFLI